MGRLLLSPLDCIRGRLDGAEDLSDAELRDVIDDLQRRARRRQAERTLDGTETALFDAAEDVARDLDVAAAVERRNAAINALVAHAIERKRAGFDDWYETLMAHLVGVEDNRPGARNGIDQRGLALEAKLLGGMVAELRRRNLVAFLSARKQGGIRGFWDGEGVLDREIAQELWQLDLPDGRPGVSGSPQAREIAAIIRTAQETARRLQNRAGAVIGRLPGWIVRQSHDMALLRRAGFEAWRDVILPRLDAGRTFAGADPDQFLRGVYDGLASGVHLKTEGAGRATGLTGPANLARRLSEERVLHFRSADDWYDYHRTFGNGSLMEAVVSGLGHAARNTALMEGLGTNPRAMFDRMLAHAQEQSRGDLKTSDKLRDSTLENFFLELDGTTRIPAGVRMAQIFRAWRALNSMAMLGGSVISSITDIPVQAAELRFQGARGARGLLDGYANALQSMLPAGPDRRAAADLVRIGLDAMLGTVAARVTATDDVPGRAAKLLRTFFRLNLQTWWNDAHKAGFGVMMARRLAQLADRGWDALDEDTLRVLALYDIGAREWEVIRTHALRETPDGTVLVAPEAIQDAPDAAIAAMAADQLAALDSRSLDAITRWQAQSDREANWIARRRGKFEDRVQRLQQRLDELGGRRAEAQDARIAALADRIDLLRAKIDEAEVAGDITGALRGLDNQQAVRRFLDAVEGGRRAIDVATGADKRIERDARAAYGQGERLGQRRQEIRARIRDLEKRIATDQRQTSARQHDSIRRGVEMIERWQGELDAFTDRMAERIAKRQELLDSEPGRVASRRDRMIQAARDELETRLQNYYTDRTDHAIVTPGARERAFANRGTRPGTVVGEAARMFWQFKQFPLTLAFRVLMRELHGRGHADLVGFVHLAVAMTALGYVAMAAKDLSKGREPRDPADPATWLAAFVQGGGAGIYGDFLLGEYNRFGGGFFETVGGPAVGQVSDVARLWGAIRDGDGNAANQLFRLAKNNAPFLNLFYTRMLFDYLFLYQVQEMVAPGSLRRMERRVERDNNQRFILPPSEVVR
jgi:hypothetical protein